MSASAYERSVERAERLAGLPFQTTDARRDGIIRGVTRPIAEVFAQRELLGLLVRRELKARYKDSSLGFLWSLIKPLTLLLIYFVAIGQFLGAARAIPQFGIFVYTGLTLWTLYSEIIVTGTSSILTNAGLIKKVYLPRQIFPLAAAGSALVNFAVQFGILIAAILILGELPLWENLYYVPIAVAITLVYAVALAIMLSALNVYLRDIQYLVEVGMLVFFWASPIVYSWSFVVQAAERSNLPWLTEVYLLNPMSTAMLAFQRGLWVAGSEERQVDAVTTIPPQPWPENLDLRLILTLLVGLVLLAVAQRIFSRLQGNFAQEI